MAFWFCFIFFWLSLIRIYVDAISINYLFAFFPLIALFVKGKFQKPSGFILLLLFIYSLIFVLGVVINIFDDISLQPRRFISYLLFISIFFYSFVELTENIVEAFKKAIIIISFYYSFESIVTFFISGGNALGFEQKDVVGSQRFGFVYLFALFILIVDSSYMKKYRNVFIWVLVVGCFLTFSRATIVAMICTYTLYFFVKGKDINKGAKKKSISTILKGILFLTAISLVLVYYFPVLIDFFYERIIGRLFLAEDGYDLTKEDNSEGFRFQVWKAILNLVLSNPFTGSAYLGSYILKDVTVGSAHNQYFDILLRTGFVGFACYLILMYKVCRYLYSQYKYFFWGTVSVLFYGFFHETFKETQGAFILCFLIGLYSNAMTRGNFFVKSIKK
jgi:O-antigen ligase